jgi:hypothetical protein
MSEAISMMPLAAIRIATRQTKYTKGVAGPENGVENWGLKKVETPGPIIAADMMTAPSSRTESFLSPACKGSPKGVPLSIFAIFPPKYLDFGSIPTDYFIGHSLALQSFVVVSGPAGRLIPQAI